MHNGANRTMPNKDFPYDVFLSHNRAQKDWTRKLARNLDEKNIKVWFDEWRLPAGTVASKGMELGVEQSRHVVLVLSPEFLNSEWTDFETQIGIVLDPANRERKLLPILYSKCDVPPRISRISWIDFSDTHGNEDRYAYRLQQLLADLRPDLYERPKDFERFKEQRRQMGHQDPERIPQVGPLPKGSRMPHAPSKLFVGREKELGDLAQSLTPGALVGVHAAVTGMGGVGKTQLAIEYAHRYGRHYPGGVFWLNMENADNAINEVAACGGAEGMNLPHFSDLKTPDQAALVRKQWEEGDQARLLIFDNAEDPEVVKHWRPVTGLCSVLISSRRQDWPLDMGVRALPVETLPRTNSMEMLEKARPRLAEDLAEQKAANDLCDFLGDLPLGLKVAAAYLQKYHAETVAGYLQDLRQASTSDSELSELKDVWACFAVSYRKLKPEDKTDALALRIFHAGAYFAPVSILPKLLAQAADLDEGRREEQKRFSHSVARLQELSLISQEPDGRFLLHRLLRQFASKLKTAEPTQEEAALKVWKVLKEFAAREINTGLPQGLTSERAHLREAATEAEDPNPQIAAELYNWLGSHARMLALLGEARTDQERALKLGEQAHGPEHPSVSTYANNLGLVLQDQGDRTGALEYLRRALKIGEQAYSSEHPEVASLANNLGTVLQDQGDLTGALHYAQRALKIDEQAYGPNHPSVARDANNIGQILKDQGDLPGALEHAQRALKIGEEVYGPNHPTVAICVNNIGLILQAQGDLAGALEHTQRALKIDEHVYGLNHPNVAIDANNLGQILRRQGDLAGAEDHIGRALEIFRKTYGPDNPSTRTVARNLRGLQEEIDAQNRKQPKNRKAASE